MLSYPLKLTLPDSLSLCSGQLLIVNDCRKQKCEVVYIPFSLSASTGDVQERDWEVQPLHKNGALQCSHL